MGRRPGRLGLVVVGAAVGFVGLAGLALAAEEPPPTPRGFVGWLENPVPSGLPFRLTGEVEIGVQKLEGERDSSNFRTYQVIEEGFAANRFRLGLETKDQRRFIEFQGLDISKNDQNYQVSIGQYGRYRLDFEWDQIPHLYGKGQTPFERSEGGMYNLPAGIAAAVPNPAYFNGSTVSNFKVRKDIAKAGFWWAPTSEWDIQLNYEHTRHAGNRPMGAGIEHPEGGNIVELPEPIEWKTDQLNAIVGYATKVWQLQGGYRLSIFGNGIKTMTFDNPLFTGAACVVGGPNVNCAAQGRTVLAPDNQAHNLFLSGGVNLPLATRLTAKVAYGINRQNDTFFAQTINGAVAALDPTGLQLYSPSLRGDVRTLAVNATGTSRPIRDVTVTAGYRFYSRDNRTLVQTFPDLAIRDADVVGETRFSRIYDYQKQNGDLDVAWRVFRPLTLRAGFGWERWERPDTREVGRSDEYSGKFGLTYRPFSWFEVVTRYTRSWKRIDNYNTYGPLLHLVLPASVPVDMAGFQAPDLRKFDEAARDRHKAEVTLRLMPVQNLDVGISAAFSQDRYPFSPLGLQENRNWSAGVDIGYTPVSWLTLRANYEREEGHSRQRSRERDDSLPVPFDFVDYEWISRNVDTFDTVGAGALVRLIPDRLDLQGKYGFQRSIARLNSFNPVTPVQGTPATIPGAMATSFPDDRFTLHRFSGTLRYWLLKNLALRLGYTYQRFRTSYWQTDFLQQMNGTPPTMDAGTDVFLGVKPFQNYELHVIGGGITYGF